jgi:thiopurine S-methyltransferase
MEPDFWLSRWQQGMTGFHGEAVHQDLLAHEEVFLGGGPHTVFVPLCGKTVDLDWLASRGHRVVGVELSPVAIAAIVSRLGAPFTQDTLGPYERWSGPGLTLLRGDVLLATPELLGAVDRIWDRAALVALPPEMRPRYTATLRALLRPGGLLLQNSFSYDQTAMDGPPFSVPPDEVARHYAGWAAEPLDHRVETEGKFRERGAERFDTHVTLLRTP